MFIYVEGIDRAYQFSCFFKVSITLSVEMPRTLAASHIIQMRSGFSHPNINLDNPIDDEVRFTRSEYENADVEYSINNSFGFGGINSCSGIQEGSHLKIMENK